MWSINEKVKFGAVDWGGQGKWTGQGKLNQRKDFESVGIESQELSDFGWKSLMRSPFRAWAWMRSGCMLVITLECWCTSVEVSVWWSKAKVYVFALMYECWVECLRVCMLVITLERWCGAVMVCVGVLFDGLDWDSIELSSFGWMEDVDVERLRRELIKFEFDGFNFLIVMQINDRSSLWW